MAQKIYGIVSDSGDGSSCMHWYRSIDKVDEMLDPRNGHENYWSSNEGGPAEILDFPNDLDLEACGFTFSDDGD